MKNTILVILASLIINLAVSQEPVKIEDNRFLKKINNKFGVTDSLNKTIVPFVYDFIEYKNKRLIVRKNNKHGLLTSDNQVVIPIHYEFIYPREKDRFLIGSHKRFTGLSDADGKIILPVKYKGLSSVGKDDFYITRNDKNLNGVYDLNGINLLPEMYQFYTVDNYKIFALKDSKPQILDLKKTEQVIEIDTNIIFIKTRRHFAMGERFYQIVKKENKYGVINADNQIVIPLIFDEVKSSDNWRYFLIKKNNKFGLINVKGQIIKEPIYDRIDLRKEHVVLKRNNHKDERYSYELFIVPSTPGSN
jgi:hypothetical protein